LRTGALLGAGANGAQEQRCAAVGNRDMSTPIVRREVTLRVSSWIGGPTVSVG
jgi:hypothetical protein